MADKEPNTTNILPFELYSIAIQAICFHLKKNIIDVDAYEFHERLFKIPCPKYGNKRSFATFRYYMNLAKINPSAPDLKFLAVETACIWSKGILLFQEVPERITKTRIYSPLTPKDEMNSLSLEYVPKKIEYLLTLQQYYKMPMKALKQLAKRWRINLYRKKQIKSSNSQAYVNVFFTKGMILITGFLRENFTLPGKYFFPAARSIIAAFTFFKSGEHNNYKIYTIPKMINTIPLPLDSDDFTDKVTNLTFFKFNVDEHNRSYFVEEGKNEEFVLPKNMFN